MGVQELPPNALHRLTGTVSVKWKQEVVKHHCQYPSPELPLSHKTTIYDAI